MNVDYLKKKTCCGIVLYNPDIEKLRKNITTIYHQVDKIICIDNNSSNQIEIMNLLKLFQNMQIEYIKNEENFGIAKALNQILNYAYKNGYNWYITMDQDSVCSETLINEYAKQIDIFDDIAVFCPFVLNNNKTLYEEYMNLDLPPYEIVNDPTNCITSATLNNTAKAIEIGGYLDKLFIDGVDFEFNLRIIQRGYKIIRVNTAFMFQSMGDGYNVPLIKLLYKITKSDNLRRLQVTPVYSNNRLYYIWRNGYYLRRKYDKLTGIRLSRKWMNFQFIYFFLTYPLNRSRIKMLKAVKKGKRDSLKMGD